MNIRRTGERKNIAVFAILPTVCEGCVIFTTSQPRGHVIPARRKVTSTPGIRPTGSLRIALGERCFREPTLRAALVRRTGQRLTARDCQGNQRPHAPKCRAALRASRATPLAHYKLRSL